MCDVDEQEFAEYLLYVKARMAPPIPGPPLAAPVPRGARLVLIPPALAEA